MFPRGHNRRGSAPPPDGSRGPMSEALHNYLQATGQMPGGGDDFPPRAGPNFGRRASASGPPRGPGPGFAQGPFGPGGFQQAPRGRRPAFSGQGPLMDDPQAFLDSLPPEAFADFTDSEDEEDQPPFFDPRAVPGGPRGHPAGFGGRGGGGGFQPRPTRPDYRQQMNAMRDAGGPPPRGGGPMGPGGGFGPHRGGGVFGPGMAGAPGGPPRGFGGPRPSFGPRPGFAGPGGRGGGFGPGGFGGPRMGGGGRPGGMGMGSMPPDYDEFDDDSDEYYP